MSDTEFLDQISTSLSKIRKQQRYTQREVAELAGLNPNYYAKVERGDSIPSLKTIYKIAKALKVSATDIVGF
jgi:transcriptional regulator with XRE-family HTH domain